MAFGDLKRFAVEAVQAFMAAALSDDAEALGITPEEVIAAHKFRDALDDLEGLD